MRNSRKDWIILFCFTFLVFLLTSCNSKKMYAYYEDTNNYISVSGTISHIQWSEELTGLYLGFTDMSVSLPDNCFKVVGDNFLILQTKKNAELIKIGTPVTFITAPKIFGDGYVAPIVSIELNNTMILEFDEGVENLLS